jgi:MFS family permease
MTQPHLTSIESRQSWIVAIVATVIMMFSFGVPWITTVALAPIAEEAGGTRSVPSLAVALAWFGSGIGGIAMGQIAERVGVRWTVMFGAVMMGIGLALSTLGPGWQMNVGHGVFMGLIGLAGINAPLFVYVTRWFDRRRGSALALISSGSYLAGAAWPPVFAQSIAAYGWRQTMIWYGLALVCVIVPLALIFLRMPPEVPATPVTSSAKSQAASVLGWPPNLTFAFLAAALILCCIPMAMPQSHVVAFCGDLGITASQGAAMLSLMLASAFVARQVWGVISDRIGGLLTMLAGSAIQAVTLSAFLVTQDEAGLFYVAAAFGLGFSGLIPATLLAARELFPASEAAWRLPILLLFSGSGMAIGGWLAGVIYDQAGYYGPAFATGVGVNLLHFLVVSVLVLRYRHYVMAR